MDFNGSKTAILHHLGEISATQSIILHEQREQRDILQLHTLQLDRLERSKPSGPAWYQTDKFWLTVGAGGAMLAGFPDLAKLLMPH